MDGGENQTIAYGDFQTPDALAVAATAKLREIGLAPASVIEPSCGKGAFLAAAAQIFPTARLFGADINDAYIDVARTRLPHADLRLANFFETSWPEVLEALPQPWLILGNPPWVTVAGLGAIGATNAPARRNAEGWRGIDALTGRHGLHGHGLDHQRAALVGEAKAGAVCGLELKEQPGYKAETQNGIVNDLADDGVKHPMRRSLGKGYSL